MRIDPDERRDPDLLAAEVRRLRAVIAAGEPTLADEEREALEFAVETGRVAIHDEATLRNLLERLTHDVAPEARAAEPESSVPLGSVAAPANTHTLADEEREAITCAADLLIGSKPGATLRKLLERLS